MDFTAILAAGAILVLVAGCGLFFVIGRRAGTNDEAERQHVAGTSAEQTAKRIVGDAERDAQSLRKTAVLEGKEELIRLREEWEAEARKRREDVEGDERRLQERTGIIERKADALEQRERDIKRTAADVAAREASLGERQAELDRLIADERRRLESLAGMSAADAKGELIKRLEEEAHADAANRLRVIREESRRNADREAKKI
ncbi:MAG TPA: Rnase Y domain-containing protein, partial [Gemmatimonadaceae bacterium]